MHLHRHRHRGTRLRHRLVEAQGEAEATEGSRVSTRGCEGGMWRWGGVDRLVGGLSMY